MRPAVVRCGRAGHYIYFRERFFLIVLAVRHTRADGLRGVLRDVYAAIPCKRETFTALRSVWVPPESVYRHLHFKGDFRVEHEDCRFLIRHHGFQVENEIFWGGLLGGWEKVSLSLWLKLCRGASTILDVGANTGIYALCAKAASPGSRVVAFEPVQRVFEKLRLNCELNSFDIECFQQAASDRDGTGVIIDPPSDHVYSVTVDGGWDCAGATRAVVPTIRLDSFIAQRGLARVDLIKIDVETHEPQVLAGLGEHLQRMRPTMLVEVLSDELGARVEELVQGCGYVFFDIDEKGPPRRVARIRKSSGFNYLLCSESQALALGLS